MKKHLNKAVNGLLLLSIIILTFFSVKAQARYAPLDESTVNYTISNVVVVSDKVIEFDLYLKNMNPDKPFELSIIQAGVLVNSDIINGGNITTMVVPGFSDLIQQQQPTNAIWAKGPVTSIIKVTPKVGPGPGNGTIISTTEKGTRICRVRITNSVPFAKVRPNFTFCFTPSPYPTKVFQYIGRVSTQLMTNSGNCFSNAANPVLNE
jgi:hypothetical protein